MRFHLTSLLLAAAVSFAAGQDSSPSSPLLNDMNRWEQEVAQTELSLSSLSKLPDVPFDPRSEMPDIVPGSTAVLADSGMYFDERRACVVYVGNVRLNHVSLQLRAAHRLYVLMPEKEKKTAADEISDTDAPPGATPHARQPAAPTKQPQQPAALPVEISAQNAAVDTIVSRVLLEGLPGAPSLTFRRGEDTLVVQAQASGKPARAYADEAGNVLLLGSRFSGSMTHEAERYELNAQQGPVEYDATTRTITIHGKAVLKSPRGTVECTRLMRLSFAPGETPPKPEPGNKPFSQFTNMRLGQISYAEAHGDVICTMPEQEGRPASRATGESLTYDGATGDCRLRGKPCTLTYGQQSLQTSGEIHLEPSGDASITGDNISGSYERPLAGAKNGPTVIGTFTTCGPVLYSANDHCISLPAGITAQDPYARFSCSGETQIFLLESTSPLPPRKPGTPNLSIAHHQGLSLLRASGCVNLHSEATDTQPMADAVCDSLEADFVRGTAHLQAQDAHAASLHYGDYSLCAQSPSSQVADVQVLDNGDLLAHGDRILTKLPGDKGSTSITCADFMKLERERALLFLGPQSVIDAPDGIMTAVSAMDAELFRGPPSTHPRLPKYPHLDYNFTGLRSAVTQQGGSLRTVKLSMQCDGPIRIRMVPGASTSFRDALELASARDHVRLAGKDANGKLIRADGDFLDFDRASGNIYLRGTRVSLMDSYNTHTASGRGACITLDPKNNIRIDGEHQTTTANRIHQQVESQKKK